MDVVIDTPLFVESFCFNHAMIHNDLSVQLVVFAFSTIHDVLRVQLAVESIQNMTNKINRYATFDNVNVKFLLQPYDDSQLRMCTIGCWIY